MKHEMLGTKDAASVNVTNMQTSEQEYKPGRLVFDPDMIVPTPVNHNYAYALCPDCQATFRVETSNVDIFQTGPTLLDKLQEKYNEIHNRIEEALCTDWDKPYNADTFQVDFEKQMKAAELIRQEARGFDEAVALILGVKAQAKLWDHYRVEFLGEELEKDTKPTQDEQRTYNQTNEPGTAS